MTYFQYYLIFINTANIICTHVTQDRTRYPGYPAVQLRLTCDQMIQICTGSESFHVKYGARDKEK